MGPLKKDQRIRNAPQGPIFEWILSKKGQKDESRGPVGLGWILPKKDQKADPAVRSLGGHSQKKTRKANPSAQSLDGYSQKKTAAWTKSVAPQRDTRTELRVPA